MGGRLGLWLSGAVLLVLALVQAGLPSSESVQRASDVLQLLLSAAAAAACFGASGRGSQPASRPFWFAIGLGCSFWACGQVTWVVEGPPFSPGVTYPGADLLFTASRACWLVAFVVRPERDDVRLLSIAIDVILAFVAMLYLFCETALPHLIAGDVAGYEASSSMLIELAGLALLPMILWSLRAATPRWRPLYAELAPAFVLHQLGTVVSNLSFEVEWTLGPYRAGFYDLPWTLPFVWIGLLAGRWRVEPAASVREARPRPASWERTRRATVVAFVSVLLFPVVHIIAAWQDPPASPLAPWRAAIAFVGTLLVAGLYLFRQLFVMRDAEKTLREGEERYRVLLDSSADAVGVYGADLRVRYVSGAITGIAGVRPDERIGRDVIELVHPDDAERLRATLAAVLARPGELLRASVRAGGRDGLWRDLEIDAMNRLDEPAVSGVVANFRDVTGIRRAEQERERSLSLLEATLESTADGILVVGRSGRVVRFNQRFAAMWRLPREVLADGDAERMLAFVLDQLLEPQAFLDKLDRLYAEPDSDSFDTLRFKDGRVFERYSLPQRLAGEVVGRVYSFRDVTGRVHAEQAMARLVGIIEATPDFVGTFDASSFRPLYVNRAGRRMLGLADGEPLVARTFAELHTPPAAERLLEEAIPQALRAGAWSGESRLRRTDGHEIPVLQAVLAHRAQDGDVDFLSTIARDISQRIEAEQQLRRSDTMAALGSLVAGVAHEVRNPLFGISSTLDAFEARFARHADYRPYVQVLREQLSRLTSLMNDLLEYATPTRLRLEPGRLEDAIAHALAACAPLQQRTRARVETSLASDLPALRMDERRLAQVFRNLLENALQHAGATGRVGLEARVVASRGASWLECRVEDDGPGFDPEDLPRVFEPFFTRRQGGTGLGLSIVQRIVNDHGGSVAASNREAGGARLTVSLPAALREA
jgi:PAS domain S-box-containing protein